MSAPALQPSAKAAPSWWRCRSKPACCSRSCSPSSTASMPLPDPIARSWRACRGAPSKWPPGRDENSEHVPGVLVFATAAPLTFTNAQYIRDKIMTALAAAPVPVKLLLIEASGMIDIDYTGSQILQQTIVQLRSRSIEVAIARL